MSIQYTELQIEDIKKYIDDGLALIVTATPTETKATHKKIKPIEGFESIIKVYEGDYTYYLGTFGNYRVAHVQCGMGSISPDSSIMTVTEALQILVPKFVIMIGIAFGINPENQNIGDVLVSECVIPHNFKKVTDEETTHRATIGNASKTLLNRFKATGSWEYLVKNEIPAKVFFTHVLSGEELIDNKDYRDELIKTFPTSKGGEMEGAGLYAACESKIDWILVKGICDFADGNKKENKKEYQETAIDSALSLCLEVFSAKYAFKDLNLHNLENDGSKNTVDSLQNCGDVLFDTYDTDKESFYINREYDDIFSNSLDQYSIWIHGISGCGKTNLILRNLIIKEYKFLPINLAACIGLDIGNMFHEILCDIFQQATGENKLEKPKSFKETSQKMIETLKKYYPGKKIIIFIEEIPISKAQEYAQFAEMIFSILILKQLDTDLKDLKFVLSSIESPLDLIKPYQQKIHQQMKFINLNNWEELDARRLIKLIIKEINLSFSSDIEEQLLKDSNKSPRFIKKYFRNILTCNAIEPTEQKSLIAETRRELGQS